MRRSKVYAYNLICCDGKIIEPIIEHDPDGITVIWECQKCEKQAEIGLDDGDLIAILVDTISNNSGVRFRDSEGNFIENEEIEEGYDDDEE